MSKVYWPLYEVFVRSKQGYPIVTSAVCTLPMIKWRWRMPAMPTPAAAKAAQFGGEGQRNRCFAAGRSRRILRPGGKQSLPSSDFLYRAGRHGTYVRRR